MRKTLMLALAGAAMLSACGKKPADTPKAPAAPGSGPASGAHPAALPQRAPGLWEQKITTSGMTQVSQVCLDKAAEQRLTWWGQHAGEGACSAAQVTPRPGGGWSFASTCNMGDNGVTATKGEVTGDFAKAYKLEAQSTITGASAPQMNGSHAMTLEATWKGPCPAGLKPGDMVLPGGMKINMMEIPTR